MIEELVATGHAYPAGGDVYFRVAASPTTGSSPAPRRRGGDAQPSEEAEEGAQGGPARLRALEGAQGGRGHVVGLALGPRPAGLAHRVLGDGRGASRAGLRDPRRRARPRLPAPRERGGAVALARARVRAALDAQRDAAALRREDVEVARQHRLAARGAGRARAARRCSSTSSAATGASRSTTRTRCWQQAAAQAESFRNVFRAARASPEATGSAFAAALDDDFNTPDALAVMHALARPRAARRGLEVFGLESLAERRVGAAGARGAGASARSRRARAQGLRRRRPAARRDRGRRLGGPRRDAEPASSSCRSGDQRARLRPARRARGAARAAARCSSSARPSGR